MKPLTYGLMTLPLFLTACAIHQHVQPVSKIDDKQVCVVENSAVRVGFLDAYKRALAAKGYSVRQLLPNAALNECPVVSTYTANWRWDLALYMEYAEITVYADTKPVGKAVYDAKRGGGNMGKFIDADLKVKELVDKLFVAGGSQ